MLSCNKGTVSLVVVRNVAMVYLAPAVLPLLRLATHDALIWKAPELTLLYARALCARAGPVPRGEWILNHVRGVLRDT